MVRVFDSRIDGFKVCHINAQSLLPKIDEFRSLFEGCRVDAVCVSETWLSSWVNDRMCGMMGYKVFRADRCDRIGGGVAIYVKEGLSCKIKCISPPGCEIEYIFLQIVSSEDKLLLGTVYRPDKRISLAPLVSILENISTDFPNMIVCGDLNSNLLVERELINDMRTFDLRPVNVDTPTHFSGLACTLLDVLFVSELEKVLFYDQLSAPAFSKHDLVYLTFDFVLTPFCTTFQYKDFKHINSTALESNIRSTNWERTQYMPCVNEQVEFLQTNIDRLFNAHVPLKTRTTDQVSRSWFNNDILLLMDQRDLAYNRWKRYRLEEHHHAYRSLRNRVVSKIRAEKKNFFTNRLNASLCKRKLWNNLREIGIGKQAGNSFMNQDIDCNKLNQSFLSIPSPVTYQYPSEHRPD